MVVAATESKQGESIMPAQARHSSPASPERYLRQDQIGYAPVKEIIVVFSSEVIFFSLLIIIRRETIPMSWKLSSQMCVHPTFSCALQVNMGSFSSLTVKGVGIK